MGKNKKIVPQNMTLTKGWDFSSIVDTMMAIAGGLFIIAFVVVGVYGMAITGVGAQRVQVRDLSSGRSLNARLGTGQCPAFPNGIIRVNSQTINQQWTPFIENDGYGGVYVGWSDLFYVPSVTVLQELDQNNNFLSPQEVAVDNSGGVNKLTPVGVLTTNNILAYTRTTQSPNADVYLYSYKHFQQLLNQNGNFVAQQANYYFNGDELAQSPAARNDGGIDIAFEAMYVSTSSAVAVRRFAANIPGRGPVTPLDAKDVYFQTSAYNSYLNLNPDIALDENNMGISTWERTPNATTINHEIVVRGYNSNNLTAIEFLDPQEVVVSLPGHDSRYGQTIFIPNGYFTAYLDGGPGIPYYALSIQLLNPDRTRNGPPITLPLQMSTSNGFRIKALADRAFIAASSSHEHIPGTSRLFGQQIWFNGTLLGDLFVVDPTNSTNFSQTAPRLVHRGNNRVSVIYQNNTNDATANNDIGLITLNHDPYVNVPVQYVVPENSGEVSLCGAFVEPFFSTPSRIDSYISIPSGTGQLTGADPITGVLHISAQAPNSVANFNGQLNAIGYTPSNYYYGVFPITYNTSANNGPWVITQSQINVTRINIPPVILNNTLTIVENGSAQPFIRVLWDPNALPSEQNCDLNGIVGLVFQLKNSQGNVLSTGITSFNYNSSINQLWSSSTGVIPAYSLNCDGVSSTATIHYSLPPNQSNPPSPNPHQATPKNNQLGTTIAYGLISATVIGTAAYVGKRFIRNDVKRDHEYNQDGYFANRIVAKLGLSMVNFTSDDSGKKFYIFITGLTNSIILNEASLAKKLADYKEYHNWFFDFITRSYLCFPLVLLGVRQAHEREIDRYVNIFINELEKVKDISGKSILVNNTKNCTSWMYRIFIGKTFNTDLANQKFSEIVTAIQAVISSDKEIEMSVLSNDNNINMGDVTDNSNSNTNKKKWGCMPV